MCFDFKNYTSRLLSILFCSAVILQIIGNVCIKLGNDKDKQDVVLTGNTEYDEQTEFINDDYETESEEEIEFENDKIVAHQNLNFTKNCMNFLSVSQARLIQINLCSGFLKTIILPPEQT